MLEAVSSLRKTPIYVSSMQEANQFDSISGMLDPQAIITDPDPVIALIPFNLLDAAKLIQRVTCLQLFDELRELLLYPRIAGIASRSFPKVLA